MKLFSLTPMKILFVMLFSLGLISGCAGIPKEERHPDDPFENFNRAVFVFNDGLDRSILKPTARIYRELPDPVQTGAGNFFSNLDDVRVALNNLLQAKPDQALSDVMRVVINSTLGLAGLIDLATPMGLERHNEDFGQTLGYWGVPSGPYLQLPFLGPSTVRDAPSRIVDRQTHPFSYGLLEAHDQTRTGLTILNVVDTRARLIDVEESIVGISEDRYIVLRDAWLQRREFLVRDGKSEYQDAFWLDELDMLDALEAIEGEGFPP